MFAASQKSHCVSRPPAAPGRPRRTPPCAQDQVSQLHAPSQPLPALSCVHTFLSPHVSLLSRPRTHTIRDLTSTGGSPSPPPSRARWRPSARTRASPSRVHRLPAFPKSLLAHVHLLASLQAHLLTRPQSDKRTDRQTPRSTNVPPSPRTPPEPELRRRVAALLPPRLPGPRLFGLLSGYVAEGSFPLVLPIENKVSLYLMVMADVRRIWQMKRPFALKYCSLRRVSLPTHHDPIFFSGCLTRMTNELIFSVHRWEM